MAPIACAAFGEAVSILCILPARHAVVPKHELSPQTTRTEGRTQHASQLCLLPIDVGYVRPSSVTV
jgi:hypothetical protein